MPVEKVGFLYNSTVCIACGACQLACQGAHGLGSGEYFRRVVLRPVGGGKETAFSGGCNHCAHPACVAACPTGAMYRDEEKGVVLHDDGRCIGSDVRRNSLPVFSAAEHRGGSLPGLSARTGRSGSTV